MKNSIKIKKLPEMLICFLLILNCRSIFLTFENGDFLNYALSLALVFLLIFVPLLRHDYSKKRLLISFEIISFVTAILLIYLGATRFNTLPLFINIITIVSMIFYIFSQKKFRFVIDWFLTLEKIISAIAIISMSFWLFMSILHVLPPTNSIYSSWQGREVDTFLFLYFETQTITPSFMQGTSIIRNSAIFAEAPMASFVFSLGLMSKLFITKEKNIKKIILLVVAVISTLSTTGIIFVILSILMKYIFTHFKNKDLNILKIFIIPLLFLISISIIIIAFNNKMETSSGSIRLDDFYAGFSAWSTSKVFGVGFYNDNAIIAFMSEWRLRNIGYSNSIMRILAEGGIYLTMVYSFPVLLSLFYSVKNRDFEFLCFTLLFVLMFSVTSVSFQYIIYFIFILFGFVFYYSKNSSLKNTHSYLKKHFNGDNL